MDDKIPGCSDWSQNETGNKCHREPIVQWTFQAGLNVTKVCHGWTFCQGALGATLKFEELSKFKSQLENRGPIHGELRGKSKVKILYYCSFDLVYAQRT
jgi:hypothetical protein